MRATDPDRAIRDFGRRVAEERVNLGWTQENFAEQAGVSVRYIRHIEQGRQNLTIRSASKLSQVLHVPLAELFMAPKSGKARRGRPARAAGPRRR